MQTVINKRGAISKRAGFVFLSAIIALLLGFQWGRTFAGNSLYRELQRQGLTPERAVAFVSETKASVATTEKGFLKQAECDLKLYKLLATGRMDELRKAARDQAFASLEEGWPFENQTESERKFIFSLTEEVAEKDAKFKVFAPPKPTERRSEE